MRSQLTAAIRSIATIVAALTLIAARPAVASGTGTVETPAAGRPQSGIGLISGWHCSARRIDVRIDDGLPQSAGVRTPRGDTRQVCGHAEAGFGLLFNFNLLDPGPHRLTAYADGVAFQTIEFRTVDFGVNYLRGAHGRFPLHNFPAVGSTTYVEWSEQNQNFVVGQVTAAPPVDGDYFGARVERDCAGVIGTRHGTFHVTTRGATIVLSVRWVDGATETLPERPYTVDADGYLAFATTDGVRHRVNGERLVADWPRIDEPCRATQIVAAR